MLKLNSSKFAAAGIAVVLAISLTACGGADEAAQVDDQTLITEVE